MDMRNGRVSTGKEATMCDVWIDAAGEILEPTSPRAQEAAENQHDADMRAAAWFSTSTGDDHE